MDDHSFLSGFSPRPGEPHFKDNKLFSAFRRAAKSVAVRVMVVNYAIQSSVAYDREATRSAAVYGLTTIGGSILALSSLLADDARGAALMGAFSVISGVYTRLGYAPVFNKIRTCTRCQLDQLKK